MYEDYLMHWSILKGGKSKNHKYIARIGSPGKYQYFYTQKEYDSYLRGRNDKTFKRTGSDEYYLKPDAWKKAMDQRKTDVTRTKSKYRQAAYSLKERMNSHTPGQKMLKSVNKILNVIDRKLGVRIKKTTDAFGTVKLSVEKHEKIKSIKDSLKNAMKPKRDIERAASDAKTLSDVPRIVDRKSTRVDQTAINPNFDRSKYEYSNNCAFCTAAYDLRRRGYDVMASKVTESDYNTVSEILSWYEGAKKEDLYGGKVVHNAKNPIRWERPYVDHVLRNWKDGDYGHLLLFWENGGGHSCIISKENGQVVIRDSQTDRIVEPYEYFYRAKEAYVFNSSQFPVSKKIKKAITY